MTLEIVGTKGEMLGMRVYVYKYETMQIKSSFYRMINPIVYKNSKERPMHYIKKFLHRKYLKKFIDLEFFKKLGFKKFKEIFENNREVVEGNLDGGINGCILNGAYDESLPISSFGGLDMMFENPIFDLIVSRHF